MDDILKELEAELKSLRPRRPSAGLLARFERELGVVRPRRLYTAATTFRSWKWAGWRLAAVAAVVLTVSLGVWRHLGRALVHSPSSGSVRQSIVASASPAAARSQPAAAPAPPEHYRPVGATNVLYDMKDEGPAYLADNTPARRMRYRYVDTYTWRAPASNASLKWSVPREEVRVIPARLH